MLRRLLSLPAELYLLIIEKADFDELGSLETF